MFARLIATVAALLLACASPQAHAYARADLVQSALDLKTALPARARAEQPATGPITAVTLCRIYKIRPSAPECASAHKEYANNNPYKYTDPDGRESSSFYTMPQYRMAQPDAATMSTGLGLAADFTPIVGDVKGFAEAFQNPTFVNFAAATVGLVPGIGDAAGKLLKNSDEVWGALNDGASLPTDEALDAAIGYLGSGYKEIAPGVFKSGDGTGMVRMTDSDLARTGNHAGAPHMNFEKGDTVVKPNGKEQFVSKENKHIFLPEEKR